MRAAPSATQAGRARAGVDDDRRARRRSAAPASRDVERHRDRVLRRGGKRQPDAAVRLQFADQPAALGRRPAPGRPPATSAPATSSVVRSAPPASSRGMICRIVRPPAARPRRKGESAGSCAHAAAGAMHARRRRRLRLAARRAASADNRIEAGADQSVDFREDRNFGDDGEAAGCAGDRPIGAARRARSGCATAGPPSSGSAASNPTWTSTKAMALDALGASARAAPACASTIPATASSGGDFEDGTIGRWLEESLAVLGALVAGAARPGRLLDGRLDRAACRARARRRRRSGAPRRPGADRAGGRFHRGADVAAPAARRRARRSCATGVSSAPRAYAPEPYPITRALIEDGRRHLLLGGLVRIHAPGPHPAGHAGPRRALRARHDAGRAHADGPGDADAGRATATTGCRGRRTSRG